VVLIEVTSNVGIGVFDAPSVVVSVFRESGELAVKVAVFTLAVRRGRKVQHSLLGECRLRAGGVLGVEFDVHRWVFGCSRNRRCDTRLDGLGVNTEFVCELANRVRPWHSDMLFTTGSYS
jgi:hypothetical protein